MLQYILLVIAAVTILAGPALETLASAGPSIDYIVAFGVALMLKPWLSGHFG
ncbi:hypothetical protein MNBD_GAMMA15-1842 [hydrothermal vent metagenome]|uniref:Uncharacterized protein n=1 Tax=hydrothermal vent metagenome TaxID=652676 RepID=A0A3B0YWV8_9ZZZZ